MINESTEVFIVEIAPGSYWLNTTGHRVSSIGLASHATHVLEGSLAYNLDEELFPRESFPHVRLVKIRITVQEKKSDAYHRYVKMLTDMFALYIVKGSLTENEEESYAAAMQTLRSQFTSTDVAQIEHDIATAPRQALKVYLDDRRDTPQGWVRTRTARGTINLMDHTNVTHLSLDHDLGEGHGTGYEVACWLEEAVLLRGFAMPIVTIQTTAWGGATSSEPSTPSTRRCPMAERSRFASGLRTLLDETGLLTRTEWASFLGETVSTLEYWTDDAVLPSADRLTMIIDGVRLTGAAIKAPLEAFMLLHDVPSAEVTPLYAFMGRTLGDYLLEPLMDGLRRTLQTVPFNDRERACLDAAAAIRAVRGEKRDVDGS